MDDSFVPLALFQSSARISVGLTHVHIYLYIHSCPLGGTKYNSVTNEHGEIGGEGITVREGQQQQRESRLKNIH